MIEEYLPIPSCQTINKSKKCSFNMSRFKALPVPNLHVQQLLKSKYNENKPYFDSKNISPIDAAKKCQFFLPLFRAGSLSIRRFGNFR